MKLSQFKFSLPENLIAQHPTEERDACRMMVQSPNCWRTAP